MFSFLSSSGEVMDQQTFGKETGLNLRDVSDD